MIALMNKQTLYCDAVLFDLDGVLIDSSSSIVRHWADWAERHNLDLDTIMPAAHGVRTIETMRRVAPHLDVETEAREFCANEIVDTAGVVAIPGAARVLAALPAEAWAIVTSCNADLARARLARAGLPLPRLMVSADDVTQGKPAPEPYLAGALRVGLSPAQCIVIEDAPSGIQAGKQAGMRVLAVGATHTLAELLAAGADLAVDAISRMRIGPGDNSSRLAIELG